MDKDYDNFVQRMGSFDMELELDNVETEVELQHYGVKGMRWGVRRAVGKDGLVTRSKKKVKKAIQDHLDRTAPTTYTDSDGNTWTSYKPMTRAKENELRAKAKAKKDAESKDETDSEVKKPATANKAIIKSINPKNLSDDELREYVDRLSLENRLKKLSKETNTRIPAKDRKAMTNDEIKKVNERLQLESNLIKQAKEATKTQRILAEHALTAVGQVMLSDGKQSLMDVGMDTLINVSQDKRLYKKKG